MSDKSKLELLQTSATPQSLKDNESIQKLMDLYFSNLKEQQELSEDPLKLLDTDYLISKTSTLGSDKSGTKFDNVKSELFKIHLDEIYKIFESVADSESIYERYKEIYQTLNLGTDNLKIDFNLDNEINDSYITASNSFKSKKGTKAGFFFVNDIINKVNIDPLNSDKFFQIDEGYEGDTSVPFSYTVKASLYKEVFKETILPLSHPVGFNWHFLRLLYLTLSDHFGSIETITVKSLILTCYSLDNKKISVSNLMGMEKNEIGETVNPNTLGEVKDFFVSEDQDQREKVVIDFYAKIPYPSTDETQDGLRLVRDYNGHIIIYNRQRQIKYTHKLTGEEEIIELELEEVQLADRSQGELIVFKKKKIILGKEVEVVDSIRFKEYSIFNLDEVQIKYSFIGGTPFQQGVEINDDNRQWASSIIKLNDKVISKEKKFFESVDFTKDEIIDNSTNYNGRIEIDKGTNCSIQYEVSYQYENTTTDIDTYISGIRKNNKINGSIDTEENTIEEFDTKETFDHWARLDPNNGTIAIGELTIGDYSTIGKFSIAGDYPINAMDKGINITMGPDALIDTGKSEIDNNGNLIVSFSNEAYNPDSPTQRNEAYFRPTAWRNIKTLINGSIVNGHKIYDIPEFDDVLDDSNNKIADGTYSIYERENKENHIYYAHEYRTTDETILMTAGETAIDPIYSDGQKMPSNYSFNENHELVTSYKDGTFKGYSVIGGQVQDDGGYGTKNINDFVIGGFKDHNTSIEVCTDPEVAIYRNETTVNADPVNLLLNTYDCNTNDFTYSGDDDNVNRKGDFDNDGSIERFKTNEDGEESFADEQNTTDITYAPYTDDYNYEQHDWDLQDLTIGNFHIKGKPRPILDNSHIVDGKRINATTEFIQMDSINTLEYNNFTNMTGPIGSFTINDNSEIGGHLYSQDVQAEIYQAVWNTHEWDSDNIDEFVYAYDGDSDNVNKKGDFKNDGKDIDYKIQNSGKEDNDGNDIYEEVFASERVVDDVYIDQGSDDYNFAQHDLMISEVGAIGSWVIKGEETPITESDSEDHTINMNRHPSLDYAPGYDWQSLYAINKRENQLNQGDSLDSGLYIGGEVTYDYGDQNDVNGFADPVNINRTAKDPGIFGMIFGNVGGENEDLRENEVSLKWVGDSETGSWQPYKTQNSGIEENQATWVVENTGYEERLEHSELGVIQRDYWEIEEQNYNIGEDGIVYVGGIPKPIQEPEHTKITWLATLGTPYNPTTYVDLMAQGTNDIIGEGFIGGDTAALGGGIVNADVYKDAWYDDDKTLGASIDPTTFDEVTTFIQDSGKKDTDSNDILEEVFAEENTNDLQTKGFEDLYNFRNYGKEISDFSIGSNEFIGGELHDIEDNTYKIGDTVLNASFVHFEVFKDENYTYNTFNNAMSETSNIGDTGTYIGGELHTEKVNADVYKGEWNSNTHDDDTIDFIYDRKIINEPVINGTQYKDETNNVTEDIFAQEINETKETSDIGYDYYNFRNYGQEVGDITIGGTGTYIGGELREIDDDSHTDINDIIINSTTIKFTPFKNEKYVYNTFNNALYETGNIGDANTYIGGELHEEEVNADVYKGEWNSNTHDDDTIDQINEEKRIDEPVINGTQYKDETNNVTEDVFAQDPSTTKETHKPVYDDYNLRNADGLIGANMVIGGSMTGDTEPAAENTFYIGGELREIQDQLDSMVISTMGGNSYTELVVDSPLVIGEGEIGTTYIKARLVEWTNRDEESFMNVGQFDIFSDEDNWDIGVYKNVNGTYVLLEDNNVSALS